MERGRAHSKTIRSSDCRRESPCGSRRSDTPGFRHSPERTDGPDAHWRPGKCDNHDPKHRRREKETNRRCHLPQPRVHAGWRRENEPDSCGQSPTPVRSTRAGNRSEYSGPCVELTVRRSGLSKTNEKPNAANGASGTSQCDGLVPRGETNPDPPPPVRRSGPRPGDSTKRNEPTQPNCRTPRRSPAITNTKGTQRNKCGSRGPSGVVPGTKRPARLFEPRETKPTQGSI
jgi:hypothetical protein